MGLIFRFQWLEMTISFEPVLSILKIKHQTQVMKFMIKIFHGNHFEFSMARNDNLIDKKNHYIIDFITRTPNSKVTNEILIK